MGSGVTVDFDAVKSGFESSLCSTSVFLYRLFDFLHGHGPGWRGGVFRPIQRISTDRNVARAKNLLALQERRDCRSTDMPQLTVDECSLRMDGIGDFLPSCNLGRGEDTWDSWVSSSLGLSVRCLISDRGRYTDMSTDRSCLCQHKSTVGGPLRIILDVQIRWDVDALRLLGCSHTRAWCQNDTVLERKTSQASGFE